MLIELSIIGAASYAVFYRDHMKARKRWDSVMESGTWFTNKLGKSLKIWELDKTEYGWNFKIELPYSYTTADFEKDLPIFREAFGFDQVETDEDGNIIYMRGVYKRDPEVFKPYPLPPYKIMIAQGPEKPIVVDLRSFPHVLIGGDTGSGKSRLLFCILCNLIATTTQIEIYLLQCRKSDLEIFSECKQVKAFATNLVEVRDALKKVDQECRRREGLIKPSNGFYSISDWNDAHKDTKDDRLKRMKYIYVVIEEFSVINISKGDSKEEKTIKAECLKYIKTIVNVGRASGVFLITALQKPTNDSIPSDIKSQLSTRISLVIKDEAPAIVIMGNNTPTMLRKRQVIVRTLDRRQGLTYEIGHENIIENIRPYIVAKPAAPLPAPEPAAAAIPKPAGKSELGSMWEARK